MKTAPPQAATGCRELLILEQKLTFDPYPRHLTTNMLRGAIAGLFREDNRFHQHTADELLYRYPRVQYRLARGKCFLLAIDDAARALSGKILPGTVIRLGNSYHTIASCQSSVRTGNLSLTDTLHRYRSAAPLLLLNQRNYERFLNMAPGQKQQELDRLAVAHLLRLCKGLDYWVPGRLHAAFGADRQVLCNYKEQQLTGFLGTLETNLSIPDGLAIGKAVARGYGVLKRQ